MKKILLRAGLVAAALAGIVLPRTDALAGDPTITLKKDATSGLFTLTIRDAEGILEFSLARPNDLPYGGGLSGCPRTYTNNLVRFSPDAFEPVMKASVTDCAGHTIDTLELTPPVNGTAASRIPRKETPPPPPPSQKHESEKQESAAGAAAEKSAADRTLADVKYPVKELGDCGSEQECRSYCDVSTHAKECFAFAEKYHLLSAHDQAAADRFLSTVAGPGGCNSGAACESYCSDIAHIEECVAFARKTGYYAPDELAKAEKVAAMVKKGRPLPGGCTGRNACEIYCNDAAHMDECLAFAEESGMMSGEELAEARKVSEFIKRGETPGKCTSKETCEKYCFAEEHIDECIAFAEKSGLMSEEDVAIAKKTGGKGPGGCRSKTQCEAYCQDHQDECFAWAKEHGLMSDKDMERMQGGMQQFKEHMSRVGPEVLQCLKDAVGESNFQKLMEGKPLFDRALGDKMQGCFGRMAEGMTQQFANMPPEMLQCVENAIGKEAFQKMQSGQFDENANFEAMNECFKGMSGMMPGGPGGGGQYPGGYGSGGQPGGGAPVSYVDTDGCTRTGDHAAFVCGINGRGASPDTETTYFNSCTLKAHGATFLHEGVCATHTPCSDTATLVCSTENRTWVHECYAKEKGETVAHAGACGGMPVDGSIPSYPSPGGDGHYPAAGPGGCTSQESCAAYCKDHLQECMKYMPPGTAPSGLPAGGDESSAGPPVGGGSFSEQASQECAKYGGTWDGKTCAFPQPPQGGGETGVEQGIQVCTQYGGTWDGKTCSFPKGYPYQQNQQYPYQYPQ